MINQEYKAKLTKKLVVLFLVLLVFAFNITTVQAYTPVVTTPVVEEEIELTPVGNPFTPEGNLTLVDDIYTNNEGDKQFITAVSKSGHYFYLVIDRAGDNDNVYLLNLVDEADLMALMYDEEVEVTYTLLSEEDEPEPEPEIVPEPTPEPEIEVIEEETEGKSSIFPLVLLLGLGAAAGFYHFKIKPSQGSKGNPMFDEDYDEEDEDEEEENDD